MIKKNDKAKKDKQYEVEIEVADPANNIDVYSTHNQSVVIDKIKNGYLVKTCCGSKEQAEFIENIMSAPAIIKKMFNMGNKSGNEISELVKK